MIHPGVSAFTRGRKQGKAIEIKCDYWMREEKREREIKSCFRLPGREDAWSFASAQSWTLSPQPVDGHTLLDVYSGSLLRFSL